MKKKLLFSFLLAWTSLLPAQKTWHEEALSLDSRPAPLYGTLSVSDTCRSCPVVVIIPGSGPTDRDCNAALGLKTNTYRLISEGLAQAGIACFRFDKRGIGESRKALIREDDLVFGQNVDDVLGWLAVLKHDKRLGRVVIAGHSEGSLIGMLVANKTELAGFISLAGPGMPAADLLKGQLKGRLSADDQTMAEKLLDSLSNGLRVTHHSQKLNELFRPSIQNYLISWFRIDPSHEISLLNVPILIVQGENDVQVGLRDSELLHAASPKSKMLIFKGMDHIMKRYSPKDRPSEVENYVNPSIPLHRDFLPAITGFIQSIR